MNCFSKWWWAHSSRVFTDLGFNRVFFWGVQEYSPTRWGIRIIVFLLTSAPAAIWRFRLMIGFVITFRQTDPATLNENVLFETYRQSVHDPSILEGWLESHCGLSRLFTTFLYHIPFYAGQLWSRDILERFPLSSPLWKHSHMTDRSMFKVLADLINCWWVIFSDWSVETWKLISNSSFIFYFIYIFGTWPKLFHVTLVLLHCKQRFIYERKQIISHQRNSSWHRFHTRILTLQDICVTD